MSVKVRRARREDARVIAEFALRLFAQHRGYNARRFAEIASIEGAERFYGNQTSAKDAAVLVAELNEKIVVSPIYNLKRRTTPPCSKTRRGCTIYTSTKRHAGRILVKV